MWQALLGFDLPWPVKFIIAFAVLLCLLAGLFYVLRRFGGRALGAATGGRGRQPRLAVIDSAMVDSRRQLILIRRDNVEHLIMTGGPTDIVIEPSIVRATPAATGREAAPMRAAPSVAETLPRAVPLADGGNWPLQPDAPPMRAEPALRAEPPMRPQRAAPPAAPPAPPPPQAAAEDAGAREPDWSPPEESAAEKRPRSEPALRAEPMLRAVPDPEPAERPERPQRAARSPNPERLTGLAADLSRGFKDQDMPAAPRGAADQRRPPPPPVQPPVQPLSEAEEQNLTEMAQRLESALQRPRPAAEPPAAPPPPPPPSPALRAVELPRIEPKPQRPEIVPVAAKPAAGATPAPAPKPAAKQAFGTLEQEMASLLGRSSAGKT